MAAYLEQPAPASLARWIECAWTIESDHAIANHRVPPDGCLDIFYDRQDGLRAIGAMTQQQHFDLPNGASQGGVRFHPGMAGEFLKLPPAKLTDVSIPLDCLWKPAEARNLKQQMDDARSIRDAMRILIHSLPQPEHAPNPVQQAIESITQSHGTANIGQAAAQANLSPRHFRRRCLEESGLAPKLLSRVLRFRHACQIANESNRPDWVSIALDAAYFDQAHLIRDFREFTGATPMAFFSNTSTARAE